MIVNIKGGDLMSFGLFANISSQSNYKNYITGQADRLFDYEYIYSAINSTGVTAAEIETAYLQFRQRRPFCLEYYCFCQTNQYNQHNTSLYSPFLESTVRRISSHGNRNQKQQDRCPYRLE